ncbi:hypothetical protein [Rhizobium sp. 21-4511-3d]
MHRGVRRKLVYGQADALYRWSGNHHRRIADFDVPASEDAGSERYDVAERDLPPAVLGSSLSSVAKS